MSFLEDNCTFTTYNQKVLDACKPFDCDHPDLNEFFSKDVVPYTSELLGKSYCFTLDEDPTVIVCAFTVSNDSIRAPSLPNARRARVTRNIPGVKRMRNYPSVLIGRLGVNKDFRGAGVGDQLMDFIKSWFVHPNNKTGCRFIVVDSYNEQRPLAYYKRNGFEGIFTNEDQEKTALGLPLEIQLRTRLLYFDLIVLKVENEKPVEDKIQLFESRFTQDFINALWAVGAYEMLLDALSYDDIQGLIDLNAIFSVSYLPACMTELRDVPAAEIMRLITFDSEYLKRIPKEVVAIILHEIGHVFYPHEDLTQKEFNADDFAISKGYGKYIRIHLVREAKKDSINQERISRIAIEDDDDDDD